MLIKLTENQKRRVQQIFKDLVKKMGTQNKVAISLQITEPSLSHLIKGKTLPSARVCVLIEAKYGIKKEDIRPDIFMIN
jgi:DNA-binding transcriptional regulator YdaS (Cro superfamily)